MLRKLRCFMACSYPRRRPYNIHYRLNLWAYHGGQLLKHATKLIICLNRRYTFTEASDPLQHTTYISGMTSEASEPILVTASQALCVRILQV